MMIRTLLILPLFTICLPSVCYGIDLAAVRDVWVREAGPDTTFENDWVSVWSSASDDGGVGGRRYGLIEWDLSSLAGMPLGGASFSLWSADDFSGTSHPVVMRGFLLDTDGKTPLGSLTWNQLHSEHLTPGLQQPLDSLGFFDVGVPNDDPGNLLGKYVADGGASGADLTLIEAAANSSSGLLSVLWIADEDGTDYRGDWGDGSNAGGGGLGPSTPGLLSVSFVPEPSAAVLLLAGTLFWLLSLRISSRTRA